MVQGINGSSAATLQQQQEYMQKMQELAKAYAEAQQQGAIFNGGVKTASYPTVAQPAAAGDGQDDGHISLGSKLKNLVKGGIKFFTGMFTDKQGNFSLLQTFKTVATVAAVGAVCVLTAGTAIPAAIALAGVGASALGVAGNAIQAAAATTDAEAEAAWQGMGSNGAALGLSLFGAKAIAKSKPGLSEAGKNQYNGLKGTWRAVKDSWFDVKNGIKGKDGVWTKASAAAKGKTGYWDKAKAMKDSFVDQWKSFKNGTLKENFNKVVYGKNQTIENNLTKELETKRETLNKMTAEEKASEAGQNLQKEIASLEKQQTAITEMNNTKTWSEARQKLKDTEKDLKAAKEARDAIKDTSSKEWKDANARVTELEAQQTAQENILNVRTAEAQAIKERHDNAQKQLKENKAELNKLGESEADKTIRTRLEADNKQLEAIIAETEPKLSEFELDVTKESWAQLEKNIEITEGGNLNSAQAGLNESYKQKLQGWKDLGITKENAIDATSSYNSFIRGRMQDAIINQYQQNPWTWTLGTGLAGRQFGVYTPIYGQQQMQIDPALLQAYLA